MNLIKVWLLALLFLFNYVYAGTSFVTYNIRTFDSKSVRTNKVELKKIFKRLDADFITVQEIVNSNSLKDFISKEFKDYGMYLSTCGGAGRQKIGFIYSKKKFKLISAYEDKRLSNPNSLTTKRCGRLRPALVGEFQDLKTRKRFYAVGLHLKAGSSLTSYDQRSLQYDLIQGLVSELRRKGNRNIILMGDMNTTGFNKGDIDYRNFSYMLRNIDSITASKSLKCSSYWSGLDTRDNKEESSLLDHILFKNGFLGYKYSKTKLYSFCKALNCNEVSASRLGVHYKEVSDHCPIKVEFY